MLNQSDINAEFEVNPRSLNRMLEFKRASLNKRLDRVINTTLAEQQAALTRGKITQRGAKKTEGLVEIGIDPKLVGSLTVEDRKDLLNEVFKLQFS